MWPVIGRLSNWARFQARHAASRSRHVGPWYSVHDRGAALITVLLFVVLVFILITTMLAVTGNEIVIAGLQRDGIRATDLAQAGIQEAISRVSAGRPYSLPFPISMSSLLGFSTTCPNATANPSVCVTVTRVFAGANSAYLQIDSVASNIGRATR